MYTVSVHFLTSLIHSLILTANPNTPIMREARQWDSWGELQGNERERWLRKCAARRYVGTS